MTQVEKITDVRPIEPGPGIRMYPLFGERGMLNVVEMEPGTAIELHRHEHEQLGLVLAGEITMTIDGAERVCRTDDAYAIPGGVEHGGRAGVQGCRVLDVFVPVRDDYRQLAGR